MKRPSSIIKHLQHFGERQGFALLTVLCVAVIASTALWTRSAPRSLPSAATPPVADGHAAASLWQESLPKSPTPSPLPTTQPPIWLPPLNAYDVVRGFSGDMMLQSGVTGVWSVHHAVDLAAQAGAPVTAMESGVVEACGQDSLEGAWIALRHSDGYISRYASLGLLGAFRVDDPVSRGQTIGFVGNTHREETDLGPHLHLQVFQDGNPIDPLQLLP